MNEHPARSPWIIALLVLTVAVAVGAVAYNVGLSQGLAQVGSAAAAQGSYPDGWHRHWGFGFLFPLFFFAFWIFLFRGFYWRPWGPWYYGRPRFRDDFEEWHRRAHERMNAKE